MDVVREAQAEEEAGYGRRSEEFDGRRLEEYDGQRLEEVEEVDGDAEVGSDQKMLAGMQTGQQSEDGDGDADGVRRSEDVHRDAEHVAVLIIDPMLPMTGSPWARAAIGEAL